MIRARLLDACFAGYPSASAMGDNVLRGPRYLEWVREPEAQTYACFFTDSCLHHAPEVEAVCKVAWLIEAEEFRPVPYAYIMEHWQRFDYILSHSRTLGQLLGCLFYPFGGTTVAPYDWRVYEKSKPSSIIASSKAVTAGHKLRHEVIARLNEHFDVFGWGYNPVERKLAALAPYAYTVVIENVCSDWWFTEKLLDALLTGTVPIYWGCPGIGRFFDLGGIIQVQSIEDIAQALHRVHVGGKRAYLDRLEAVGKNFRLAQAYTCAEDWIFEHYPFLFGEE